MEHARVATGDDLATLTALSEQAVSDLDGQRGGTLLAGTLIGLRPLADVLAAAIADDDSLVVLGAIDQVTVGFTAVHVDRTRRQPIGVIDAVYVEPDARQVGVGEAMLDVVVPWCGERGCLGVDAPALPGSRPAKAFFEDHGFVARLLVMHHPIPGRDREP